MTIDYEVLLKCNHYPLYIQMQFTKHLSEIVVFGQLDHANSRVKKQIIGVMKSFNLDERFTSKSASPTSTRLTGLSEYV